MILWQLTVRHNMMMAERTFFEAEPPMYLSRCRLRISDLYQVDYTFRRFLLHYRVNLAKFRQNIQSPVCILSVIVRSQCIHLSS